jgi:hypothetical protein
VHKARGAQAPVPPGDHSPEALPAAAANPARSPAELEAMAESLRHAASREEVRARLGVQRLTVADLRDLVRALGGHAMGNDRRELLERKVEEQAVGRRLSAEAIRGVSLKH